MVFNLGKHADSLKTEMDDFVGMALETKLVSLIKKKEKR